MTKEQSDVRSRIQMATRDTAMSFAAFRKADERLKSAVNEGRAMGMTDRDVESCIASSARGNPRVRMAVEDYAKWLGELSQ